MLTREISERLSGIFYNVSDEGGTLMAGGRLFSRMDTEKLIRKYSVDCSLINRSRDGITVSEAEKNIVNLMNEFHPSRILLQLGEYELESGKLSADEIASKIENAVKTIKNTDRHCAIVIVSVCGTDSFIPAAVLNSRLEEIAKNNRCRYADVTNTAHGTADEIFRALSLFIADRVTFASVMNAYGSTTPQDPDIMESYHSVSHFTVRQVASVS